VPPAFGFWGGDYQGSSESWVTTNKHGRYAAKTKVIMQGKEKHEHGSSSNQLHLIAPPWFFLVLMARVLMRYR